MKGIGKSMTEIRNIIHRLRMGHSKRRIHKELKVHRSTIRELHSLAVVQGWLSLELPMPSDEVIAQVYFQKTEIQHHPLDAYRGQIKQWDSEGLSSVVIHRLLKDKCTCDVQVIRRYRKKHFPKQIKPVMVRPTTPGKDADIDFGELGKFIDDEGNLKRVWLFSFRMRHSRRAYRKIVLDQKLQTFLMAHVEAFEYFNGVPLNIIQDNLKAAVIRSTVDNDMINRSYQELAEHYGCVISPCQPRTPEHKGGVEGDIKYSKMNFLAHFLARQKEMV